MSSIKEIINEEIMNTVANFPQFGDRLHLNEIGDASAKPYPFKYNDIGFSEVEYCFETEDQDNYIVEVINTDINNLVWDMQFNVEGEDHEQVVNKGKMFGVMATILAITNDFIDKKQPNILKFQPSKNEEGETDLRRFKLYMAYLNKNMRPEYIGYEYYPYIVIERKIKRKSNHDIPEL